ncbi:MAG TPA: alpha/beta fold hydrolase [Candidatus Babeliales bacterium]|nr:alpha/beta fold hydrolase [Candidatus Babeliales bacterium]
MKKNTRKIIVGLLFIVTICGVLVGYSAYKIAKFVSHTKFNSTKKREFEEARSLLCSECHAQPVILQTSDNITLAGLWIKRESAKYTFLLCHGFRTSKDKWLEFVRCFPHDNILAIDLRAHGESNGKIVSFGWHEVKDISTAVTWIKEQKHTQKTKIIGVGSSMGSAALLLAAQKGILLDGIIALSPFAAFDKLLEFNFTKVTRLPKFPLLKLQRWLLKRKLGVDISHIAPINEIDKLSIPLFIIHANHDPLTPVSHAQDLDRQTKSAHELWIIEGTQHGRELISHNIPEFKKRVSHWLKKCALDTTF